MRGETPSATCAEFDRDQTDAVTAMVVSGHDGFAERRKMAFTEERKLELESKYILDFERLLATRARRDCLLAGWATNLLRRNDSRAYLQELNDIAIGTPTDDDLVAKLLRDFELAGIKISKDDLARTMHEMMFEAAEELDSGRT